MFCGIANFLEQFGRDSGAFWDSDGLQQVMQSYDGGGGIPPLLVIKEPFFACSVQSFWDIWFERNRSL